MLKLKGDKIFDGTRFIYDKVLITEHDGTVTDLVTDDEAGDDIKYLQGILCPGFVNCHCHLELSHMKGLIPKETGLLEFIKRVVQQRNSPREKILEAIENAEDEMIRNGIIATGDISNTADTLPQKIKGRLRYQNFIEALGFNPDNAALDFERSYVVYQQFINSKQLPPGTTSIVPHASYTVGDGLWELIINFPGNKLLSIHNQETPEEDEWFLQKTGGFTQTFSDLKINVDFFNPTGKSSLQSYLSKFRSQHSVLLVHNVQTTLDDIQYSFSRAVNAKLYWCFCVNANQYISGVLPNLELFMNNKCDIVLGTDSLASNDSLSILSELKTIRDNYPGIDPEEMLKWATSNGARALEIDSFAGSFEKGKKPGVLRINESMDFVERIV